MKLFRLVLPLSIYYALFYEDACLKYLRSRKKPTALQNDIGLYSIFSVQM